MVSELVSIIVRFHRNGHIHYMLDALRSLAFQDYEKLQVVITIQGCTNEQETMIKEWCQKLFLNNGNDSYEQYKVIAYLPPEEGDYRSKMLNIGIDNSDGQYIGFLDYDDIVYQNAYSTLVKQAKVGGRALTAGGTVKASIIQDETHAYEYIEKKEPFLQEKRSWFDLSFDNFLPIHSYIINRDKFPDLQICEDYQALEDYDLVLRCLILTGVDLEILDTPVAEYRFRDHMRNTTQLMDECQATNRKWENGRKKIDELLHKAIVSVSLKELRTFLAERVYVD